MENLDSQVMLIIASLFLCGAIIISIAAKRFTSDETSKELWQLYWVEFALVSAVLVPIYFGGFLLLLSGIALTWRGLWELYQIYDKPSFGGLQNASYIGSALALSMVFFSDELAVGIALFTAAIIMFFSTTLNQSKDEPLNIAFTGLIFPLLPVLFIITLANHDMGFLWLFFVYLIVELNDSLAYLTGKIFGKHHPFPYLSPRKSTEGLMGGLFIAGVTGILLGVMLLDLSLWIAAGATIVILISGLLGDLATSSLKRKIGVKDFPAIHGFHGGVLDIHDAFLFAVPGFYIYFHWFIK